MFEVWTKKSGKWRRIRCSVSEQSACDIKDTLEILGIEAKACLQDSFDPETGDVIKGPYKLTDYPKTERGAYRVPLEDLPKAVMATLDETDLFAQIKFVKRGGQEASQRSWRGCYGDLVFDVAMFAVNAGALSNAVCIDVYSISATHGVPDCSKDEITITYDGNCNLN